MAMYDPISLISLNMVLLAVSELSATTGIGVSVVAALALLLVPTVLSIVAPSNMIKPISNQTRQTKHKPNRTNQNREKTKLVETSSVVEVGIGTFVGIEVGIAVGTKVGVITGILVGFEVGGSVSTVI